MAATTSDAPRRKRGRGADPAETRAGLVAAAFESLWHDGFSATTARSIAGRAGCNQAAIYYHFGGIEPLLIEALRQSSARRLERYQAEIGDVGDLVALVATVERLYAEDRASGHLAVLTELVGGLTASPALRDGITEVTEPWIDFVRARIAEAAQSVPLAAALPADDVADLLFSLVIGLELRNGIDGRVERSDRVFQLAGLAAQMVQAVGKPS